MYISIVLQPAIQAEMYYYSLLNVYLQLGMLPLSLQLAWQASIGNPAVHVNLNCRQLSSFDNAPPLDVRQIN